jgi:hypothetical protein
MKWAADVKLAGPVGSMGQRVLQPIVNQQVQHVLRSLEVQVRAKTEEQAQPAGAGTGESSSGEGAAGHPVVPSPDAAAPQAEGPKDYGEPADPTPEAEPPSGTSGADEGISPLSPEGYEPEPEGPTTSTEDAG